MIFGNEQLASVAVFQIDKELLVRDIPLRLKPMVLVKQIVESLHIFLALYRLANHATAMGQVHTMLHLLGDALLRRPTVERIVDAHPVDVEVTQLAELTIAEHFLTEVTHLDVKRPVVQTAGDGVEHLTKELVPPILAFPIGSFADNAAMHEKEGWKERCAIAHQG